MQGGVGGGHWGPNCNEPALGGPSLQKVENPCSKQCAFIRCVTLTRTFIQSASKWTVLKCFRQLALWRKSSRLKFIYWPTVWGVNISTVFLPWELWLKRSDARVIRVLLRWLASLWELSVFSWSPESSESAVPSELLPAVLCKQGVNSSITMHV